MGARHVRVAEYPGVSGAYPRDKVAMERMDSEQLARYLAGEASAEERNRVDTWSRANPDHQRELERLAVALTPETAPETWNVDAAWARVSTRLDTAPGDTSADIIPIRRPFVKWLAAAAVILAAGAGTWLLRPDRAVEYATAVGEQREITLADGSAVTLAPASRLVVDPKFGRPTRKVSLTGRAWFVVTHDEAKPFQVATDGALVEDLGTAFEIQTTGAAVRVAVAEGAVAIHRQDAASVTLGPGDVARVDGPGQTLVDHAVAVDRFTSWRQGTLDFEDRPLRDVTTELERWYAVSFDLGTDLADKRFTGPIPTGQLPEALEILGAAFPEIVVTRTGGSVSLKMKSELAP